MEYFLLVSAFLLGLISFGYNWFKHKRIVPVYLFVGGFGSILLGKVVEWEIFNLIGLGILIWAHYSNYQIIKKMDGCHPHNCNH